MNRQKFVALAAALALMLPVGTWASNHAVKVANGQWQLIGVAGIFSLAGAGTAGQNPDLSSPYSTRTGTAVIDVADTTNNISWDGNVTLGTGNSVAATAAANPHFANDATAVIANLAEANNGLGLPYHSVLGVRAINVGAQSSMAKAIVVTGYPAGSKDYQSPMRTMYIVSPLSGGEPDLMVIYQATMEGDIFKVSFKDSNSSAWDFDTSTTTDTVYTATFDHTRTYDNPVASSELNLITATSGTSGSTSGYANVVGSNAAFDMNISNFLTAAYTSTAAYDGNRSMLDGNMTMYRYVGSSKQWEIMTFEGTGVAEASTYGNNLLTEGFGYWVRLNPSSAAGAFATDYEPGFLAGNNVLGQSSFYADKLASGWNLLSFDDSTMRYATTGFVITDGATAPIGVISPYGDINISLLTSDAAGCHTFNVTATDYTAVAIGNINSLDVRCYHNGAASVLVSDKPFYLELGDPAEVTTDFVSLAGKAFTAADLVDIAAGGTQNTLSSKLGEYAVVLERNADFNALDGLTTMSPKLAVGVPAWLSVAPLEMNASALATTLDTDFSGYMMGANIGATAAQVMEIDLNATTSNFDQLADAGRAIILAADKRFYVRDNTFIRTYNTIDQNGSVLNVTYGGSNHATATGIFWSDSNSSDIDKDCSVIEAAVLAATGNEATAYCPNPDSNSTVMFISGTRLNYDVKESNTTTRLLTDVYLGGETDTNETYYGPFRRVYQASKLAKATTVNNVATTLSANLDNLTYSAVWADDFPNNGPLYYLAGNGYKPEMIITATTSDGNGVVASTGTISWKALDATRDPVEWFDPANNFEVFWAEKERGYWVYLDTGYTNPVTAENTRVSSRVVNKHFDNVINAATGEGTVFNWFDGYLTSTVGGLVRTNYTSGQSYNVQAAIGSVSVPLATTGAVSSGKSNFTTYMSDYEVSSVRPTGLLEANVSASDGLGGRASSGVTIDYVKPSTPVLSMTSNTLTATSNSYAANILIYDGNVSDMNHTAVYSTAATGGVATIAMSSVSAIAYPGTEDVNGTGGVPAYPGTLGTIVKDLRVVASTGTADTVSGGIASGASVYSNMRQQRYIPAYSSTGHLTVSVSDQNQSIGQLYNFGGVTGAATRDYGVQLGYELTGTTNIMTLVYQPKSSYTLNSAGPTHALLYADGVHVATVGYTRTGYQGEPFYLYVIEDTVGAVGSWYYGTFPGDSANATETWGVTTPTVSGSLYRLDLVKVSGLVQPL